MMWLGEDETRQGLGEPLASNYLARAREIEALIAKSIKAQE